MRLSIQRLRWVLLAGAVLLIGVLAAFIGYGRYRELKAYRQIIARSGISLTRDSNGVTWSQSIKGRKVFSIRAKSERSLGNGKWALHNADMWLYDHSGHPADHISGAEIEYDQNEGIARANGEVFMEIEPPQGLANGGRSGSPKPAPIRTPHAAAQVIQVRTSGLVYLRKLGLASTDQQVDFVYGGMHCTAVGAEFNSDESTLRLLSNVHMDGLAHGKPIHLTAARADMDQQADIANLARPVVISNGHTAKADTAILHLRKDGSIEQVQGIDHVVITSTTDTITAHRLDAVLNQQSLPETAQLSGGVVLTGTNPLRPLQGAANVIDVVFNAQGSPTRVTAIGDAKLRMVDHKTYASGLSRSMEGEKIVAALSPGQRKSSVRLTEVHVTGSAHAGGQSLANAAGDAAKGSTVPALKTVQVWADDLRVLFASSEAGKVAPEKLSGTGHTKLQQDGPRGDEEISRGDTLAIVFNPSSGRSKTNPLNPAATTIASAIQVGNVTIYDRSPAKPGALQPAAPSTGIADRASYLAATQTLTLTGAAHLSSDSGSIVAPTITLSQQTGDADASGGVQASFESLPRSGAPVRGKLAPVTHVLSSTAHFDHPGQLATFYGTDTTQARIWQGGSQVEAAKLTLDDLHKTFSARPASPGGLIHAILVANPEDTKAGTPGQAAKVIRVASETMDYNDLRREATFAGKVQIDGKMGEVSGQHAVAFMVAARPIAPGATPTTKQSQANPLGGSIDRVVVYGSVRLDQPGRHGTGEELLYNVVKGTYILTGTAESPPHISDAQQGNITGGTLVFSDAGSTIVVTGHQGASKDKTGRVRTETYVHSGKPERQ
ncbi:MAG: LptA/OstA family protein [Acidobacteriaceae bacterium]